MEAGGRHEVEVGQGKPDCVCIPRATQGEKMLSAPSYLLIA